MILVPHRGFRINIYPPQKMTWYVRVLNYMPFSLLIIDGADYTGVLLTATFSGSSTAVVQVPTLHDDDVEGAENFTAVIQVPAETTRDYRVTAGSPDTATVLINDDESKLIQSCELFSVYFAAFILILSAETQFSDHGIL